MLCLSNLPSSQLKCRFWYAKEIIQPVCICWLVFLRLSAGPLIVVVCLAVKVLQSVTLGAMNDFSPEMKKQIQFLRL